MPLIWPLILQHRYELEEAERQPIVGMLDRLADAVDARLRFAGYPQRSSPLFRPWNLAVAKDATKVLVLLSPLTSGTATELWLDHTGQTLAPDALARWAPEHQGWPVAFSATLPHPGTPGEADTLAQIAIDHVKTVEQKKILEGLGDLSGVSHLAPHFRDFLKEHPDPARNVFVMMRFQETQQHEEAYTAIKTTLQDRGYHAVRADDRDFTGELWSNIQVYMTCSLYGIALFEDIESRDFNPNVALELGYMMALQKRCLILKERHLPNLPADVIGRLYKPWDSYKITETISHQVGTWVDVDLGGPEPSRARDQHSTHVSQAPDAS